MFIRKLSSLFRRKDGSVSVISALTLPMLVAVVGLVAEYGNGLMHKVEDQRVADAAAFAAATAYNNDSSASLTSVVDEVASMNSVPTSGISASIVSSPSGDGNSAVKVILNTSVPLLLSRILGNTATTLNISAVSYAELKGGAPGCIIALNSAGTGVSVTGGATVSAPACAVASDETVNCANSGNTITTIDVDWSTTAPIGCSGIQAPSGKTVSIKHATTPDPLAGNAGVTAATGRLTTVTSTSGPSAPSVSGGTALYVNGSGALSGLPSGCADAGGNPHVITCTGNGPFVFGAITNRGGQSWTINMTGTSPEIDVNGEIAFTSGGTATITGGGPITYKISQGIVVSGGDTMTLGAGTFYLGGNSASCNSSTGYAICNSSTLTFNGPSNFILGGGIYNSGGSTLTLGSGSTNVFDVAHAADGNSFVAGGGAKTIFADATGACSSVGSVTLVSCFFMDGNFNISSGGGSCTQVSASSQHDIDGFFATAGGVILGSGVYTVSDYIGLGNNGGGDVSCWGSTVGMQGSGVTFVTGAGSTMSGTCAGESFCVAAGYGSVTLTAPSSGTTANLVVIGPTNGSTAGAGFSEGSSNTSLSGAFYFPTAPITLSGAANVGNGTGQCLMLIGSQVTLSGGSTLGSTCTGLGNGSLNSSVVLVE